MIERAIKIKVLGYYEGNACVCGRHKVKKHWLCARDRAKFRDTPEGKALDRTCDAHIIAGLNYIAMVGKHHEGVNK